MSAKDHSLVANKDVLEELRAAVRDLPFLDTLGQIDGAYFLREGGEWHWAVKTQPLLQTSLQSSEHGGYNEGDCHGYHGQGSMQARGASMTSYPFSARGNPLKSRTASGPDLSGQPRWEVDHSEIYSDNDDSRGGANCTDWTGDAEEDVDAGAEHDAEDNGDHGADHYAEEEVEVDEVDEMEDTEKEQDSSNQSCGKGRTSSSKLLPLNPALSLSYSSKNLSGEKESNGEEPDEEEPDEQWSGGEESDEDVSDFEETPHGFQQRQKLLREQSKLLSQIRPRQQQQPDQIISKKYTQKKNIRHHQTSSHSLKRSLAESEGKEADRTFSPSKKPKHAAWNDTEYDGLHKLLMEQRAHEKATNQKLLRDVKLWSLMSDRLKEFHNIERSPASCRAFWSRDGRTRSKFDERANPNPNMLATCLQGKKNGKREGIKTTKERENANSQEEGYEEEDQEYGSQGEYFRDDS
jgi:hypothetical protein